MRYYDVTTRKRPDFNEMYAELYEVGRKSTGMYYIVCLCGEGMPSKSAVFRHWEQGHFDVYDEVKEKTIICK